MGKWFTHEQNEGEEKKPFYKHVYYKNGYTSVCMPIGLHLFGKLYIFLAYRWGDAHKRLKVVTMGEWNKHYSDGYNDAMRDMGEGEVEIVN